MQSKHCNTTVTFYEMFKKYLTPLLDTEAVRTQMSEIYIYH